MSEPDIQPALVARLQAECPSLVTVSDAWFMAPLDNLAEDTPAAFAYLQEDGASGEVETICPRQSITLAYGVWIVCRREALIPIRSEIRAALFGWAATEQHNPMAYRSGKSDLRGEYVWYLEIWSTDTTIRSSKP